MTYMLTMQTHFNRNIHPKSYLLFTKGLFLKDFCICWVQ